MPARENTHALLPHLFRQEYARMTAVLCRHFGLEQIELAEDIAGDTFLKASESWAVNGIPDNPVAWLYTVARNKVRDYLRHRTVFETKIRPDFRDDNYSTEYFDFDEGLITDSQLAMIFAVCNPELSAESQICLALQVLCGFSVEEIANAFLAEPETIKKRLHRARTRLREDNFRIVALGETDIHPRIDAVLKTLYLLFNEGYFSRTHDRAVRKELCSEAVRLNLVLTENPLTNTPEANALLALMCYQSSRLEARTDGDGQIVRYEEQDRSFWDQSLIDKGNYYLINAGGGEELSKYHLEAAIAYWHTQPDTLASAPEPTEIRTVKTSKWQHILLLYDELLRIEYAPVAALNRAFAYAQVYGNREAIRETEILAFNETSDYHALLGYLYASIDASKAAGHYGRAITLSRSEAGRQVLVKQLGSL